MMDTWTKSSKGIGIVICNFKKGGIPHAIDLKICDTVIIEHQCQGWYQGYLFNNREISGIFPSAYVHIKKTSKRCSHTSDRNRLTLTLEEEDELVVDELTETLKEWNKAQRRNYETGGTDMTMVRAAIQAETRKLFTLRTLFTSPYLTSGQRSQLRTDIANKMDWGNNSRRLPLVTTCCSFSSNEVLEYSVVDTGMQMGGMSTGCSIGRKLGLDVVPRVDGRQVDPDSMSAARLYQIHESTNICQAGMAALPGTTSTVKKLASYQSNSHHLYLQLKGLNHPELSEDVAIYFSLYNYTSGGSSDFITERVMCKRRRDGLVQGVESGEYFTNMFVDLTTEDLKLDVYLTAHIYRLGGLIKTKEKAKSNKNVVAYKCPYGCAAVALRDVLQYRALSADEQPDDGQLGKDFYMPLVLTKNKDDDFSTLTDHLIQRIRDRKTSELDTLNVAVSLGMFHGDVSTVKHDYPQLFHKKMKITQKIGFADVIAPEYTAHYVLLGNERRNDFYINIYEGDFERGTKTADKNVEARVLVVTNDGEEKICIDGATSEEKLEYYGSAVFYHSNRPRWNEVIKVALPEDAFHDCHIRIEFRHCSTQGAEKKLFAFSYFRLERSSGSTIQDGSHSLCVYKPRSKTYTTTALKKGKRPHYFDLPAENTEIAGSLTRTSNPYCSLSPKEMCCVRTTLCSTKLTQDENLVNFFRWKDPQNRLSIEDCLRNVLEVKGDELMRHHTDFLTALFEMTCDVDASHHQALIFQALIHILKFTKEKNYQQFLPIFELYVDQTFCAPLAHRELLTQIQVVLDDKNPKENSLLTKVIDVLDLLFKFIVRSAKMYAEKREDHNHHILSKGMEEFWKSLQHVIENTKRRSYTHEYKFNKMAVIARVVDVFPDLIQLLPADQLAKSFSETISKIPKRDSDFSEHKLKCLSKLINSPLFEHEDSRTIVLELCNAQIKDCLHSQQDLKLAAQNLADLLDAISRNKDTMKAEVELVVLELIGVLCGCILALESPDCVGLLASCLITMISMMDDALAIKILRAQGSPRNLKNFLLEVFKILTNCITKGWIPTDWVVMLMVINSVILKAAQFFSQALADSFIDQANFDRKLWEEFYTLCVVFIIQTCLQLERFSERKQTTLKSRYSGDMRLEMASLLYQMWDTLGEFGDNQRAFIPSMVGPFLEVALLPVDELRKTMMPIFYDMLMFSFEQVQEEIVDELDRLYGEGKGDASFKCAFSNLISDRANYDSSGYKGLVLQYVTSVSTLIDHLLDYRVVKMERGDHVDTVMLCLVNLLDFYQNDIKRKELCSFYICKLRDLNISVMRYTEAARTLLVDAVKLEWTKTKLPKTVGYPAQQEWERKEQYYLEIIDYFDKGQAWEYAIPLCKELATLYETKRCDYIKLTEILKKQAQLYSKIVPGQASDVRVPSNFYRIALYGQSLPHCVRDKSFICKEDGYCQLSVMTNKLKREFSNAEPLKESIDRPDAGQLNPNKQYFQVVSVEPDTIIADMFPDLLTSSIDHRIADFYKWNNVDTFIYDKPYHEHKDKENEHRTLHKKRYVMVTTSTMPGISHWCELKSATEHVLQPIEVAIETMNKKNSTMKKLINDYRIDRNRNDNELAQMLTGTVDANVNGGIPMYQRAFLTPEYASEHPEHSDYIKQLKECINEHVMSIIPDGLRLFKQIVSGGMKMLLSRLLEEYPKVRATVCYSDVTWDAVSLGSVGSGSMLSVIDPQSNDSPRASSGYASSDVEVARPTHEDTLSRRHRHLPGASSVEELSGGATPKGKDGSVVSEDHLRRGNSKFYAEIPDLSKLNVDLQSKFEDASSDEDKDGTLKREDAPPPLPNKRRSSSLSVQSTTSLQSPDSPRLFPAVANFTNRPLPQPPSQTPASRKPQRNHTVCAPGNRKIESVATDYQVPRSSNDSRLSIRRPLPTPKENRTSTGSEEGTPPPPPPKTGALTNPSIKLEARAPSTINEGDFADPPASPVGSRPHSMASEENLNIPTLPPRNRALSVGRLAQPATPPPRSRTTSSSSNAPPPLPKKLKSSESLG